MSCNHNGRTCCRTCGEEVFRDLDVVWERRMSNLLDTVENPASIPEGAPGSLHRRAWELGQRLKEKDSASSAKPDEVESVKAVRAMHSIISM